MKDVVDSLVILRGRGSPLADQRKEDIQLAYALFTKYSYEGPNKRLNKRLEGCHLPTIPWVLASHILGNDPHGFVVLPKKKPGISGKMESGMERGLDTFTS